MKKLILGLFAVGLLGSFLMQAKWVEVPQIGSFEKISAIGNHLWAISVVKKQEKGRKVWEYSLVNFDHASKSWKKVASLKGRPKALVALTDGTALVFDIGQYTKETQAKHQELQRQVVLAKKKKFQDLVSQGKLSKDLVAVRDAFEKKDPVNGWFKFLSSEEFRKADRDTRFAVEGAGSQIFEKIMKIQDVYDSTFTKFRSNGQSTVHNVKLSGFFESGVTGSPDGAIFLLPHTEETRESRIAFEAAMKAARLVALEQAKKDSEWISMLNSFKKGVQEGRMDKKLFDLINSALLVYNPFDGQEQNPKFVSVFNEAKKLDENSQKQFGFILYAFGSIAVNKYLSPKEEI